MVMGKMNETNLTVRKDLFDNLNQMVTSESGNGDKTSFDYNFIYEDYCGEIISGKIEEVETDTEPFFHRKEVLDRPNAAEGSTVSAILIEVPHEAITEEIASYNNSSNLVLNSSINNKLRSNNRQYPSTDGEIKVRNQTATTKTGCFFLNNGSSNSPLYIVKSDHLREESNKTGSPPDIQKETKIKNERRRSQKKFSRTSASKSNSLFGKNGLEAAKCTDSSKNTDLTWLLNFKLNEINSVNFRPLDEIPELPAKSNAKISDCLKDELSDSKDGKKNGEEPLECDESSLSSVKKKPPFTYTELIECALQEKGPLTVSEIYRWISDTFPYYKAWDDRWKNSVRHNLSINPYFRKGSKARQGSGHLWTVSKSAASAGKNSSWKRQRYQDFEEYTKRMRVEEEEEDAKEAALAAANIEDKENKEIRNDILLSIDDSGIEASLEQTAEEILSGVKRNVAVEYIEPPSLTKSSTDEKNNEFLMNPVSKEVLMGECGFLNQIELNLTAESAENISIIETEQVFELPEELVFQYTDATTQGPQLLSLVN